VAVMCCLQFSFCGFSPDVIHGSANIDDEYAENPGANSRSGCQ
jgi:hypothetical protein